MAARDFRAMIKEGMTVLDSDGGSVGTIVEVFMGTGSDEVEVLADARGGPDSSGVLPDAADPFVDGRDLPDALRRRLVAEALEDCAGNYTRVAGRLGVSRQAVSYLIRQLGLERKKRTDQAGGL